MIVVFVLGAARLIALADGDVTAYVLGGAILVLASYGIVGTLATGKKASTPGGR
jgi:hypothetical protein